MSNDILNSFGVTDEVLRRFKFAPNVIEKNHILPKTHKMKKMGIEQILKA